MPNDPRVAALMEALQQYGQQDPYTPPAASSADSAEQREAWLGQRTKRRPVYGPGSGDLGPDILRQLMNFVGDVTLNTHAYEGPRRHVRTGSPINALSGNPGGGYGDFLLGSRPKSPKGGGV